MRGTFSNRVPFPGGDVTTMVDTFRPSPGKRSGEFRALGTGLDSAGIPGRLVAAAAFWEKALEIGRNRAMVAQPSLHCNINATKKRVRQHGACKVALSRIAACRALAKFAREKNVNRETP